MEKIGLLSFLLLVLHTSADGPAPGLIKQIIHVDVKMSWYAARHYCLINSGQQYVASDKNDVKNFSSSDNQLSWVGLYSFYTSWYWMDANTPTYFKWYGECASLSKLGYWYAQTCDEKLFFVCKKVSGDGVLIRENKTWQEAKQHCETDHAGLAIIRNLKDNDYTHSLLDNSLAWIGLATVKVYPFKETWRWVNNETVTFSMWSNRLFCAVIDWRGFWHDRACFEEHPFICFIKVNGILEFSLVNENKTWNEAQSHCKLLNMSLVMVKTEAELSLLVVYIFGKRRSFADNLYFWMGLYNNPWFWFDSKIKIQNWNRMQPDNLDFKNESLSPVRTACGALKDGELFDESCVDPLPFFCVATVRSMILVSQPKSWMEALQHCRDRYVDFTSLSTAMEQQVAMNKVKGAQSRYVWIGLNFLAGGWIWVYGDKIQYNNWVTGVNLQCPVALRCGALTVANGKWEPRPCEENLEFLCFQK